VEVAWVKHGRESPSPIPFSTRGKRGQGGPARGGKKKGTGEGAGQKFTPRSPRESLGGNEVPLKR